MVTYNGTPERTEDEIIADLRRLTSVYELSKQVQCPMSTETIMKCIKRILEKEVEPRDKNYIV